MMPLSQSPFGFSEFLTMLHAAGTDGGAARVDLPARLAAPVGESVDVVAVIVSGDDLKPAISGYLLKITSVNGKALGKPVLTEFSCKDGAKVRLATDAFELHRLKTGKEVDELDGLLVKELEKGYIGEEIRLTGHLEKWEKMISKEEQPNRAVVDGSRFVVTKQL